MNRIKHKLLILALAPLGLAACSLAPRYERPAAPVAAEWKQAGSGERVAADIGWREFLADEKLRRVVEQALANNRDLRVAVANIDRARALYGVQRAAQLPTIAATAGESASRTPAALSTTGEDRVSRSYNAGVGISSWELDLFGRIQSLKEQALAQYLASEETLRATQLSLVAEVANAWLTLGADRERLQFAQRTLAAQRESLRLVQGRFDAGSASGLDLAQAQTSAESARVDAARYGAQVEQDLNALNLLVGSPVTDDLLPAALGEARFASIDELPAGLPAETLLRRPDVRAAEQNLIAANASIGAARAAFFPRVSLTSSIGFASPALENLFQGESRTWSFAPSISLPLFAGGANRANLSAAEALKVGQVATYEKTVQAAFRDVADALAQRATIAEQLDAQQALARASGDALRLSQARFDNGVSAYQTVLDAQRSEYAAQQSLIGTRLTRALNQVTLYRQLGGGVKE
ncbi:MAG: efflux transporter outer membrane subunit [Candidatus Dactylopiibacterium sp.]|nr:efflux transporter outer membrane subunit [Candidatus Dactylopiibacterium sp.]